MNTSSILENLPDVKMGNLLGEFPSTLEVQSTTQAIKEIVGDEPVEIKPIVNGHSNWVFVAHMPNDHLYVVKKGKNEDAYEVFLKNKIVTDMVRDKLNIEIPKIEFIYRTQESAYCIFDYIPGIPANSLIKDQPKVWFQLGKIAKQVNSLDVPLFNSKFDGNSLKYYSSWEEYVEAEIEVCLEKTYREYWKLLDAKDLDKLTKSIAGYKKLKFKPHLIHGDIWLKNVKLDSNNQVTSLLDWDNAASGIAPYAEFARSFENRSTEEQNAFTEGYGITQNDLGKWAFLDRTILALEWFLKHLTTLISNGEFESALEHEMALKKLLK